MALRRNNRAIDNKFVKIQTRKAISSYGGSGSIIETPFGALMIDRFDEWPFFHFNKQDGKTFIDSSYHINDERLLQRLSHKDGFEKLEAFVYVPDNVSSSSRADIPEHINDTISASFFPKWFYCNSGSFVINLIKLDNFEEPSRDLESKRFLLEAEKPSVLEISGGYANGFKAMEPHSKLMVFSNFGLEESKNDDFRYDLNTWSAEW